MGRTPLFRKLILALQAARRENLESQKLPPPIAYNAKNWTRRKFVKTTASIGIASLVSGCLTFPQEAEALSSEPSIAIIGAGIAGLNAAYQLKKAGHTATVYEARSRIGGRIHSVELGDGLVVDIGAELINTDHADMLALAEEFGIELFNRKADATNASFPVSAYYFHGTNHSEAQLADELRLIAGQMTADAALLDEDWDTYAPRFDRLSVADYLILHSKKINKPYLIELFRAVVRSEFGAEWDESSAIQFISTLPVIDGQSVDLLSYSDETYSVVGGSANITDAIGVELKGQIHFGMRLTEIKKQAGRFNLSFANQTSVAADVVIVAIPFPVLSGIKLEVPLPKLLRRFIDEAKLGSNEKLIAGFARRVWRQQQGFTDAAWGDIGFSVVWDETQRQSTREDGALNFFLGGEQARALGRIDETETLTKQFIAKLNHFLPSIADAATGQFINSAWTKSPLTQGSYANYKPGQLTKFGELYWVESDVTDERQQVSAGNLIFAGEHLSDAFYGFMNGAAQTGRLAAALVLEKIAAK